MIINIILITSLLINIILSLFLLKTKNVNNVKNKEIRTILNTLELDIHQARKKYNINK